MKTIIGRLLREPLIHFFVAGGLIFVLYANGNQQREPALDVISVSADRIDQLTAQFKSVWKRPPTAAELDKIIQGYVREEVYYREALALGLDRNDTVVRQRLRQKMEFLADTSAQLMKPTNAELQDYLVANDRKYRGGARRALEQIFLGQTPSPERIDRTLTRLRSAPEMNTTALSERTMLPAELGLSLPEAIDSVYGKDFFEQIQAFAIDQWSGPVVSAYGVHLVRVLDRREAQARPLNEIREAVLRDWQADRADELRALDYAARQSRFTVEIAAHEAPAKADDQ